ncbi:uncharacterized protein I303_102110 [Kwoniella dejecticola CBS 10117]|uniref:Uncharacterized protein n=1 Tax=Kwoniella dejecticola CBS 10117 TaxID=1296121 RepID=A0A1A6ABU9_9TREE|nr:uncharacterized protein I303_01749 [Kwoniella dejecticola CBS 10117]OBR87541.1 hypothetical protein I303_01749 [Kwoniella dejecticola CBS 10117]
MSSNSAANSTSSYGEGNSFWSEPGSLASSATSASSTGSAHDRSIYFNEEGMDSFSSASSDGSAWSPPGWSDNRQPSQAPEDTELSESWSVIESST